MIHRISTSASRIVVLAIAGLLLPAMCCVASNFTAEVVRKSDNKTTISKIFVTDKKVRTETVKADVDRITIIRGDKGLTWQLHPKNKEYKEIKGAKLRSPDPEDLKKFCDVREAGEQKVAGYVCKKLVFTARDEGGPTITVWMSKKLDWPLKVQIVLAGNVSVSEYGKIKETKVADEMFELPPDYTKMAVKEPKRVP